MPIVDAKVLKKLSTFAGGGSHGRRSSSCCGEQHRRSLDEGRLGGPATSMENGTQNAEAEDLRNAIEMLIVENKHLKTLIEERDARQKSAEAMDRGSEDLEALRAECAEAQRKVDRLEEELQSKEELIASLQRERCGLVSDEEVQQLKSKVASLEAQLQFECTSHAEELQEKENRVAELEMQLLDAQRRSPSPPPETQEDLREREELQSKIEALTAELNQKEDELQKTKDLLSARETEDRHSEGGRTHAENAESQQRERDLQQRIELLQLKLSTAEQGRADAEEALKVQSKLAVGPEEAEKVIEDLRKEIRDKDEALSGMSKQLLEVSAEKDELAQELQNQRDILSAPETPRAPSGRRSFFSRSKSSAQEREALASQVQQLEEQMQKMTEKRVDLERTKVKLEGQLAEAIQELRAARSEKAAVEEKLSEREATLEALRSAHADMQKPLDAPGNLILPLPKGPQETDYDVRAASVLKDGIIRTLSSRIAHLQFALGEVTAEKEKLITQPASVALGQQLEETKTELAETLAKYRDAVNQRTELKEKVQDLTAEVRGAHLETETLRAALDEAQQRLTTTADKYKEQSDRYRGIVSDSLVKIEELQDEVLRERNGKLLVGKLYRQEMLELRHAAVLAGGVRGDPLRPLSLGASQATKEQQRQQQISSSQQAARAAASTAAPRQTNAEPFSLSTSSPIVTGDAHSPFSCGLPAALTGDAAMVSSSCSLEPIHRPRGTEERGILLGTPSRTSLTDDQRLAAEILHASVRDQQQARQTRSSPCMHEDESAFRSDSPSRSVDVEAPFTPQAMEHLQQQQQLRSAQSAQGRQQQHEQQQQPGHSQQKQQQPSQAGQASSEPSYIARARQQQEQQQQQLDEGASASSAAGRTATETTPHSTSMGTRVLVPQPNDTDQPSPSSPPDFPSSPPDNDLPAAVEGVVGRAGSVETSDGLRTHMSSGPAYHPSAVEDVLRYASPPPPRIDESTVIRDLHALQNKTKVFFSRGSASLSEAERSGSVDLS